jgi:hypothetical protein
VILVLIPVLAVFTHSLIMPVTRLMDRLFYQRETRQLRANLQRLVRQAGEDSGQEENLGYALEQLCNSVRATYGLILTFDQESLQSMATYCWEGGKIDLQMDALAADDVLHLAPGRFKPPLEEAALLVPLYAKPNSWAHWSWAARSTACGTRTRR